LQGFLDAVRFGGALLGRTKGALEGDAVALGTMIACSQRPVSGQDAKQAFIRWAEHNPAQSNTQVAIGVWAALDDSVECGPPRWYFGQGNILDKALISRLPHDLR
jgi:hypothetical protein